MFLIILRSCSTGIPTIVNPVLISVPFAMVGRQNKNSNMTIFSNALSAKPTSLLIYLCLIPFLLNFDLVIPYYCTSFMKIIFIFGLEFFRGRVGPDFF